MMLDIFKQLADQLENEASMLMGSRLKHGDVKLEVPQWMMDRLIFQMESFNKFIVPEVRLGYGRSPHYAIIVINEFLYIMVAPDGTDTPER